MCLYIDRGATKRELEEGSLIRTYYKVFVRKDGKLYSPYHKYVITGPGEVRLPDKEFTGDSIEAGAFHLRVTEDDLKTDLFFIDYMELGKPEILGVHVDKKDIIAYGIQGGVAVKAYRIDHAAWGVHTSGRPR